MIEVKIGMGKSSSGHIGFAFYVDGEYRRTMHLTEDEARAVQLALNTKYPPADLDAANARIAELEAHSAEEFIREINRRLKSGKAYLSFWDLLDEILAEWYPTADRKAQEA